MSIEEKIVRIENISTPIYVECNKMYRSLAKVCVQEFWHFVSGLNSNNMSTTVLYAKKSLQVAKYDKL